MVKNSIVLASVLVASFANVSAGILDQCPLSDTGKVVATFLAVSAVRTAVATRQLPVAVNVLGTERDESVTREVGVGAYGVSETNPSKGSVLERVAAATFNVGGLSVGNVAQDAVLTAGVFAALKYGAPVVSKLLGNK
jgi:hypothetical protein